MKHYLNGFGWDNWNELFISLFPSVKYGLTDFIAICAAISSICTFLFGLDGIVMIALFTALVTEFLSGIYVSLVVRKETLQSGKIGRFTMKVGLMFIVLFILHRMHLFFESKFLVGEFFSWCNYFFLIISIGELLVSILENYAEIQGKPKDHYSRYVQDKIDSIFNKQI